MLTPGIFAPDFALPDQKGKIRRLSDIRGHWVLLYFYPKDDTSGCTAESCAFRDRYAEFAAQNCWVLGISGDDTVSHKAFAEKYQLPFSLLADMDRKTVEAYQAFTDATTGKIARVSFLIDPHGTIVKTYLVTKPEEHPAEVLRDLRTMVLS